MLDKLKKLPKKPPASKTSMRKRVFEAGAEIERKLASGWSYADLAEALKIKSSTLQDYMAQFRAANSKRK